jgi:hypothetical protein
MFVRADEDNFLGGCLRLAIGTVAPWTDVLDGTSGPRYISADATFEYASAAYPKDLETIRRYVAVP